MHILLILLLLFIKFSGIAVIHNDLPIASDVPKTQIVLPEIPTDETPPSLPLLSIDDMEYLGAFRIKAGTIGDSKPSFSYGHIAFNTESRNSLFLSGYNLHGAVGEYVIPELVTGNDITALNIGVNKQPFVALLNKVVNTYKANRIGAMEYINGELLIHTYIYYDANSKNKTTTLIVRDAENLKDSKVDGYFSFSGLAHEVLMISPIPDEYKTALGGDYISGGGSNGNMAINGRASMGPSAWVLKSSDVIGTDKTSGDINTTPILDFDINHVIADNEKGWMKGWNGKTEYNYDGPYPNLQGENFKNAYDPEKVLDNDMWTAGSDSSYCLIVPGTRTYACFGAQRMHKTGGGYKIATNAGRLCGGPCAYGDDTENWYWFFDANDMIAVKNGEKKPYEVKPYARGKFTTPFDLYHSNNIGTRKATILGGTYDKETGTIYLSLPNIDNYQHKYDPPQVIMAFKVKLQ